MSHCSGFKLCYLTVVLLFLQGTQHVTTYSLFVSHHGNDLNNCGNWTTSCRTVRHAVRMSNDGDEIYIDYAQGRPYRECENMTKSYIEVRKSVSFGGINGKAEIRCKKRYNLFKITSTGFNTTRVKFFNLVISSSGTVAELDVGARTEIIFHNMLIRYNQIGIYSKYSSDCSVLIFNSSFESHFFGGIHLQCFNVTAHIISSTFKFSHVLLANIPSKPAVCLWQKIKVHVHKTVFDGDNTQMCYDMVLIKPSAAVVNITIIDSEFRNHFGFPCLNGEFSTLNIYDHHSKPRNKTLIFLKNLLVYNNYNKRATVALSAGFFKYSFTKIEIRDSMLRNNSEALWLSTKNFGRYSAPSPTIVVKNNTFVHNYCKLMSPNFAAAIYFYSGNIQVLSCRFLDNKASRNPYTAVATVSEEAIVTFFECYFENRQTKVHSNQLFALGKKSLYFLGQNTFNFVALNWRQPVFIRIPIAKNTGIIMSKKFKILCPQGHILNQQRQCVVIKRGIMCYYINVRCEECPTKTYTLERGELIFNKSNDIYCQQCPRGGSCDSGLVTAKPNFWGYQTNMKIAFLQCPPGYCCDSTDSISYDSCHGNRSGTLCGQCPEGMSENLFSTQCISNTECSLNDFFIIGTITILVLYLIFFLYHKEIVSLLQTISKRLLVSLNSRNEQKNNVSTDGNSSSPSGIIKILFYYYQICHLLRSSVGSTKTSQFIYNFENVISRVMNIVLVNLPSFNCPLKDLRAVPKAVILHSVGYLLLGLLGLLYLLNKLFLILRSLKNSSDRQTALQHITTTRSDQRSCTSKPSFSQRVASAFTYISLLMYASSAQLCLSLLHCVPVGDNQVLFLDGNIKCHQTFQYFLLAYMISSILPFCLVPVLGSYLLKFRRIGVKQFCAACIFPLPFCCFWLYLLVKDYRCGNQATYNTIEESDNAARSEQSNNEESLEEITIACTDSNETASQSITESAILKVLLGPFRPHQTFMCFPSLHIPWEGFLIFRRLVLIIVLTFVYDIQLRLFLALTLCVAILILHMLVNPFQRKRDNVLESFSLGTHVVLCGLTLIKALYYGEDYSSFSESLPVLNVIQTILIVAPWSIIMVVVVVSIAIKLVFGLKFCVLILIRKVRRLLRFTM